MSLRKVKDGYLIIVMFVAILLATMGGWLGWIVSIVLLSGALPMFKVIGRAFSESLLTEINQRRARASRLTRYATAAPAQDDAGPPSVIHLE